MLASFEEHLVDVGEARIFARVGGAGEPLLLLHGHPRTSATWHLVAPRLVDAGYRVVCADLRGYGRSVGPPPEPDHAAHSKRAVAADMLGAMAALGHERFGVVGHDRGSYVALRLALDHPAAVSRVALLDCLPITEHLDRADAQFARRWWHWFFFAQPEKPERAIGADPLAWYGADPASPDPAQREWAAAVQRPSVVRAMLEDYRAGLTIDAEHERADRAAGRRLAMPALVLWSLRDDLEQLHGDPLAIWRDWADDVRGHGIESGHHMAEEAPVELAAALADFFAER